MDEWERVWRLSIGSGLGVGGNCLYFGWDSEEKREWWAQGAGATVGRRERLARAAPDNTSLGSSFASGSYFIDQSPYCCIIVVSYHFIALEY